MLDFGSLHKNMDKQFEFYVSSSNKDLLKHLHAIMNKQGYLGLADGGGKLRYVIDGSKNLYDSSMQIQKIIENHFKIFNNPETIRELEEHSKLVDRLIDELLISHKFKMSLRGTNCIRYLLKVMLAEDIQFLEKHHFQSLCDDYNSSRSQIDRVISYAIKKAGMGLSNCEALAQLYLELKAKLNKKGATIKVAQHNQII